MKLKGLLFALGIYCLASSAFAVEQVIKEDTHPTSNEGAITADQIAPVYTPSASTTQQPGSQQSTTTQPTNNPPPQAPVAPVTIETAPTDTIISAPPPPASHTPTNKPIQAGTAQSTHPQQAPAVQQQNNQPGQVTDNAGQTE